MLYIKKTLQLFFTTVQIGIVVFAVLLSIVRLGVHSISSFETAVEAWFQQQGMYAEVQHLSLSVDGFIPELRINGLKINDENKQPLITLNTATLYLNVMQSLIKQHLIIDKAEFFLQNAVFDSTLLDAQNSAKNALQIPQEIAHSLLALKHFSLEIKQLDYIDLQNKKYSIFNSKITLLDRLGTKKLQFSSSLFQQKLNMLSGYFDIKFDRLLENSSFSGAGLINIDIGSLKTANLPINLVLQGDFKGQNWIEFNGLDITMISLLKAHKLSFKDATNKHNLVLDSVLQTTLKNDQLSLLLDNKKLMLNNADLSALLISAQSNFKDNVLSEHLLHIENIDVDTLAKLAATIPAFKKQTKLIAKIKPKGHINEIFLNIPDSQQLKQAHIAVKAEKLAWKAEANIPSINDFTIDAVANLKRFNADIKSDSLNLWLGALYTHPIQLDSLKASINGQIDDLATLIEIPSIQITEEKALIEGRAKFVFEKGASPYMFARFKGEQIDFKTLEPFLPQKLMDEDVLKWATNSILAASVSSADALYSGRLENDVNFGVNHNGIFIAAIKLKDVNVLYDAAWPNLKAKQASLIFKNKQIEVASDLAASLDITATDIKFSIADLDQPKAIISLNIKDELKKQWTFLGELPINQYIPYFDDVTELKGSSDTLIQLVLPLENLSAKDVLFDVRLKTQKVGFAINSLGILLGDLSGDVKIDQDGLTLNTRTAKWHGQPISLNAKTSSDRAIHFAVKANALDANSLLHLLPPQKIPYISGKSPWEIHIVINQDTTDKPIVSITAHSGLKASRIDLPEPLFLHATDINYLKVVLGIFDDNYIDISIKLDHKFDAFARLSKSGQHYQLEGANVVFGDRTVSKRLGSYVNVSGNIQELDVDHWISYLKSEDTDTKLDPLSYIKSIDLNIKRLIVHGIEAHDTALKLNSIEGGLIGTIDSSVASGTFYIPVSQLKDVPIEISMDFIKIKLNESESESSKEDIAYTSDAVPNIFLKSKKLSINNKEFTDVVLITESHQPDYFNLKALSLTHNKILINISGDWVYDSSEDKNMSKATIQVNGEDLGQSLLQLGMGDVLGNGKVAFDGVLTWPREFWNLDLGDAKGSAKLSINDGYFKDVEPGTGRLVGLFSLTALPRRLSLDFSDFFKEGLEFDQIKGNFSIENGNMWTKNLKLKGSIASIKVEGRTGLKAKDYEQIVTVTPQVRDALPVLGSLISGASVGWALLLIQAIFQESIDESVSIKYKVSGSWDDPKITVFEIPKVDEPEEINENN